MKNSIKLLAALSILGFAAPSFAQSSASANGNAAGTIVSPITIGAGALGATIQFGNIVGGSGDVTETNGTPTFSVTGMDAGAGNYGTVNDADFNVGGQSGFTFAWSTSIGTPAVTSHITLDAVNFDASTSINADAGGTGTVPATLGFGGKISDDGSQGTGLFTGTANFTVNVNYN